MPHKPPKTHHFPRRSRMWEEERCGYITTQTLHYFTDPSSHTDNVKNKIVLEGLIGEPIQQARLKTPQIYNIIRIKIGIKLYEEQTGKKVDAGLRLFRYHDLPMVAATPDGLIDDDGIIEVRSYYDLTLGSSVKHEIDRVQLLLACTDREWCDYVQVSYNKRDPEIEISRHKRDDTRIKKIIQILRPHVKEMQRMIKKITR